MTRIPLLYGFLYKVRGWFSWNSLLCWCLSRDAICSLEADFVLCGKDQKLRLRKPWISVIVLISCSWHLGEALVFLRNVLILRMT